MAAEINLLLAHQLIQRLFCRPVQQHVIQSGLFRLFRTALQRFRLPCQFLAAHKAVCHFQCPFRNLLDVYAHFPFRMKCHRHVAPGMGDGQTETSIRQKRLPRRFMANLFLFAAHFGKQYPYRQVLAAPRFRFQAGKVGIVRERSLQRSPQRLIGFFCFPNGKRARFVLPTAKQRHFSSSLLLSRCGARPFRAPRTQNPYNG